MTDRTQPEALDLADWLEAVGGGPSAKRCAALLREQHARIADLEAQLEAIGAGGVSGPLMGRAMDHFRDATKMMGRWYMVTHDGVATLCEDRRDAEKEAKDADMAWPHSGPHRAVQLVEAGHESAAANAGGEPVAEVVPCHTPSGKRVALRSEAQGLPIGTKLYTTAQAAGSVLEDAARYRWLRENWFTMSSNYQRCIAFKVGEPRWSDITEEELDAAIDAALAAQKKGEKT